MDRRTFLAGLTAASIPATALASHETLDERISRIESELAAALDERWPNGAEIIRPPHGHGAVFFIRREAPAA